MNTDVTPQIALIDKGVKTKKVLLLVHGVMMSKEVWNSQIKYFSKKYRVIAIDLYGFGASTGPLRDCKYEDHALDIRNLLNQMKIKKIHLVGWSLGGGIAIKFAHLYPQMVDKLVLVGTTPKLIASDDFPHGLPPENAKAFLDLMESDYQKGIESFIAMQVPETNNQFALDTLNRVVPKTSQTVAMRQFAATGDIDLREDAKAIMVKTLVITGELDQVNTKEAGKYLAELIPNSSFICMNGLGHVPFMTAPEKFNEILKEFLKS